jgi:hypothetical protein
MVLIRRGTENKYETPDQGPYTITKVNDNGTVCFKVNNVEDTYNIRQLTLYLGTESIDYGGECSMQIFRAKRKCN